ncbi:Predicted homoserine dehydrogenase, contains C-terminal SAF domain [Bosea lathyri]|uniref:Predicted homoserine dehydrogenase, contains C-terminal SAF domain n=1 Tax=Bosea lathyri TaxID=1036778 RepID=A0A1H6BHX8_9HYPH|nr:Predicted homoserine dehydrogenase, contains C-terminal SAF domain [Bosea lathyri]
MALNFHAHYAGITQPIETCLVGSGGFGRSFIAQARRVRLVNARIAVDVTAEAAGRAFASAGIPASEIVLCETPAEARAAWDAGRHVAAGRLETVLDLPFSMLVEATGAPEPAVRHSLLAIEAGRHVALVSKEADSVVGPGLARLAQQKGVVVTPVDGDQPSLLIALVTWAEVLGLEIIAAGKSSEYDFVLDAATGAVSCNGVTKLLPELLGHWLPGERSVVATSVERARILGQAFPLRAVPDLCEMTLVANATDLVADTAGFHAPPARVPEIADLFAEASRGGLMQGSRRIDVFHHLRLAEEASFAGGVFIVVRCEDETTWAMLAEKGHVVSRSAGTAMLYLPRHLLGVEAATSILDAAGLGRSGYGDDYRPRQDLIAVAERDLAAGTILAMGGHHHSIDGVGAQVRPAAALAADRPAPFYLVADRVLTRAIKAGEPIMLGDVAIPEDSALLAMRQRQDALFVREMEEAGLTASEPRAVNDAHRGAMAAQ